MTDEVDDGLLANSGADESSDQTTSEDSLPSWREGAVSKGHKGNSSIPPEVMKKMPPEVRQMVATALVSQTTTKPHVVGPDRLIENLSPEDCKDALDNMFDMAKLEMEKRYEDVKDARRVKSADFRWELVFVILVVIIVAVLGVLALKEGQTQLATSIFSGFGGLLAGGLGGYGIGRSKRQQ